MLVFAGVDGTGPEDDKTYSAGMANSFVRRTFLQSQAGPSKRQYLRGPTLLGKETGMLGTQTAEFVKRVTGPGDRVALAGYSRGGAAVIDAAQKLNKKGHDGKVITVDAMILFDAVDRSVRVSAGTIPDNVKSVYHVRRHPAAHSRTSFGNCGLNTASNKTHYVQSFFLATHGGVGGCPWWNDPSLQEQIKKGEIKLDDIIYEGSATMGAIIGGVLGMLVLNPVLGASVGADAAATSVTYRQDLAGSKAAWEWIRPIMAALDLIN